ncbi:DUF262 domain-containing protein [Microbacterium sp. A196]|uniref:DUF262 domain-containing protein n=1 Tax=Microbacterium sp. A196 TaxID=3457320 RepID=UPI003FD286FE
MKGYPTTFLGLFDVPVSDRPAILKVEIPIIQRDFAQGREDDETTIIRERFLDALIRAVTFDEDMGLDFIYGDVRSGVLRPLDGQQRLTTLFLLHWYVASLARTLDPQAAWLKFSYATRPTARSFTAALSRHPYPGGAQTPSAWITDQPWYVYPWRQDPTIASMLVILDAIHERFDASQCDFGAVWQRLETRTTDSSPGAIWFLFLPITDMDYGEDLYIKMNSRGKPLTSFEVFKADFEAIIKDADRARHGHLVESIDGAWADILWEYEKRYGGDKTVDDEFMRYLAFIIEICEWRDGSVNRKWRDKDSGRLLPLEERARLALADPANEHSERNREFFFHAFDTWVGVDPASVFRELFAVGADQEGSLPLFSASNDLFGACITRYGNDFSAQETLLLFAVILARQAGDLLTASDVNRRLRSLRNITAAFLDRDRYMSEYVASTEKLMLHGTIEGLAGFRDYWVADEALKWELMDSHPETASAIHELEDNSLVRGRIQAFDLDPGSISSRARAFSELSGGPIRDLLGAALLTMGDYSRDVKWGGTIRQLGNSQKDDSWMDLLTTGKRADLAFIRDPLTSLLDDYSTRHGAESATSRAALETIRAEWLSEREERSYFDWRYYLSRYEGARSSVGDGYFHNESYNAATGGFTYQGLRILYGGSYVSHFSDALLRAAWVHGTLGPIADEPRWFRQSDPGLTLKASGIEIRCLEDGFHVDVSPAREDVSIVAESVLKQFSTIGDGRVLVRQTFDGVRNVDSEDRILLCIKLVTMLADAGV